MNVKPLGEKLIVQRAEAIEQTESGIFLPESAKDKPKEGKIIAVGDGRLNHDDGTRFTICFWHFGVRKGHFHRIFDILVSECTLFAILVIRNRCFTTCF